MEKLFLGLGLPQGIDGHDVVEMTMGEQNGIGGTAVLSQAAENGGGRGAGIHDQGVTALLNEVAIGPVGAGKQIDDVHRTSRNVWREECPYSFHYNSLL